MKGYHRRYFHEKGDVFSLPLCGEKVVIPNLTVYTANGVSLDVLVLRQDIWME